MTKAKLGRNDLCHCGSGRKFKRCCEAKTADSRAARIWMIIVGVAVVASLAAGVASFRTDGSGGAKVWSQDHGHYHDASGLEVP